MISKPGVFFDTIRSSSVLFKGHLSESHVNGLNGLLQGFDVSDIKDARYQAYMLATVFHECDETMQPVEESGKGHGYDYGKMLKRGAGAGHRIPYSTPNQIYYGRGYVQLTWYENYELMGRLLGLDLLNHPELALDPVNATRIMSLGMTKGDFTGHMLSQYFNESVTDWLNARRIINGVDCAKRISGYAQAFHYALTIAA